MDVAALARLGFLLTEACLGLLGAFDNGQIASGKIDVLPSQGDNLTTAQAAQYPKQDRNKHAGRAESINQRCSLFQVISCQWLPLDFRGLHQISGIVCQCSPETRLLKSLPSDPVHVIDGAWGKSAFAIPAAIGKRFTVSLRNMCRLQFR
jgi:hypothetical protein